jgi:hypothetical protein
MSVIPALRSLRQEDSKFQASVNYKARLSQMEKKKKIKEEN